VFSYPLDRLRLLGLKAFSNGLFQGEAEKGIPDPHQGIANPDQGIAQARQGISPPRQNDQRLKTLRVDSNFFIAGYAVSNDQADQAVAPVRYRKAGIYKQDAKGFSDTSSPEMRLHHSLWNR
jgi:hypothetical protein